MKVLVINAGSSSLKFQLIDMDNKNVIAKGNVEKINEKGSFLKYKAKGQEYKFDKDITNHSEGLELVLNKLTDEKVGVITSLDEIEGIGANFKLDFKVKKITLTLLKKNEHWLLELNTFLEKLIDILVQEYNYFENDIK